MIGGLQGENGDLDIKYLKQKIKKCRLQISGSTQENFTGVQDGCEISLPEGHHFAACKIGLQLGVIGFQWL